MWGGNTGADKVEMEGMRANRDAGTPGPWGVPDQTWTRYRAVEVVASDGIPCPGSGGAMSYTNEICAMSWKGTQIWDANARRIASVPEMEAEIERLIADLARAVEALEECQADLDRYSQMEYPSDHPIHVRKRKNDFDGNPARTALASIKGQDNE